MRIAAGLLALALVACSSSEGDSTSTPSDAGCTNPGPLGTCLPGRVDAGLPIADAGTPVDGGTVEENPIDGGSIDGGSSDGGPTDPGCRDSSECRGGEICVRPGDALCGICFQSEDQCDDMRPCSEGRCVVRPPPPCSCDGSPQRTCEATCTADSCLPDELCGTDGACRPKRCDEGFTCAPFEVCAPNAPTRHGCLPLGCPEGKCPEGAFCAEGTCLPFGRCQFPPP